MKDNYLYERTVTDAIVKSLEDRVKVLATERDFFKEYDKKINIKSNIKDSTKAFSDSYENYMKEITKLEEYGNFESYPKYKNQFDKVIKFQIDQKPNSIFDWCPTIDEMHCYQQLIIYLNETNKKNRSLITFNYIYHINIIYSKSKHSRNH